MKAFMIALMIGILATFSAHGNKVKAATPAEVQQEYPNHPQGITDQTIIIPQKAEDAEDRKLFVELNKKLASEGLPPLERIVLQGNKVIWIQTFTEETKVNNK